MPETNKRAAAYVRASGVAEARHDGQAEGTSLDTQEERILERAKKEGRTVWKEDVYVDVESATVYERAALQKLLGASTYPRNGRRTGRGGRKPVCRKGWPSAPKHNWPRG